MQHDEQPFEPSPLFQRGQHRLNQFERSNEAQDRRMDGSDRDQRDRQQSGGPRTGGPRSGGARTGSARILPKGYTRPDERIRDEICETLCRSGTDVRDVSVEVSGGKVTLEGTVIDRYAKHEIEDHAAECLGVEEVDNRIRVRR